MYFFAASIPCFSAFCLEHFFCRDPYSALSEPQLLQSNAVLFGRRIQYIKCSQMRNGHVNASPLVFLPSVNLMPPNAFTFMLDYPQLTSWIFLGCQKFTQAYLNSSFWVSLERYLVQQSTFFDLLSLLSLC